MKLKLVTPEPEPDEISQLRQELAMLKAHVAAAKETGPEIAARIRAGIGPTRPIVVREIERKANEKWL